MRHEHATLLGTGTAILAVGLGASGASAAIMQTKDSSTFPNKYEMNNVSEGLDPDADTTEWALLTDGTSSATLAGGRLEINTQTTDSADDKRLWLTGQSFASGQNYSTQVNDNTGVTVELSVKPEVSQDALGGDRALEFIVSNGSEYQIVGVGLSHVYVNNVEYDTPDNTDGYHAFRLAQDSNSDLWSVYRDGALVVGDVAGVTSSNDLLYFGDIGGNMDGSSSVEYLRWTVGGFAPVPEPTSLALVALGGGLMLSRRRKK